MSMLHLNSRQQIQLNMTTLFLLHTHLFQTLQPLILESIAQAVNKRVPIVFDSGIRRGEHMFKALASGADIVAIGRPVLWGLGLGGWKGVQSVFEYFEKDLKRVMQLAGTQTIEDVKNAKLIDLK